MRCTHFPSTAVAQLQPPVRPADDNRLSLQPPPVQIVEGEPDATLPPVRVRPSEQPTAPRNVFSDYGNSNGTIPWNSNILRSDRDLVGPYRQPVWTTQRPFAGTRVYVLPAGQMQVEQWVRPTWNKDGTTEYRFLEEYAVGLPGRFQLDVYERWNVEPDNQGRGVGHHEGNQIELRWALADWGRIPFNPTLYAEWVQRGGVQQKPDKFELKLLLAEEIIPNVYYASNLIIEQEITDTYEDELAWSHAISTTVIDRKLLAGVEFQAQRITQAATRATPQNIFTIGPSFQWRFTNRFYLTTTGLFGCTPDSPIAQAYFIFGYQFGTRAGPSRIAGPSSTIGN